jgi:serine/threonine-protein kinase
MPPSSRAALFAPRPVFGALAGMCALGLAMIAYLGRDRAPAPYAAGGLVVAIVVCGMFALGWSERPGRPRHAFQLAVLIVLSATTAPVGWLFGPNAAYAALLALVLVVVGMTTGHSRVRFPALGGWLVYATIAIGQATVAALVLQGTLSDSSLLPVQPAGHPQWHHAAAHAALQISYIAAFLAGRAYSARYMRLSDELDAAIQRAARREALLDEARAAYQRALAVGRHGMFSGQQIGRFRLGDLIGRGGTGEVYDARDLEDGTIAAVKLMRGERLRDPVEVERFVAAARVAIGVAHPHVVRVREVGGLDAAIPYLAMEKLDGTSLARLVTERGRLDRATVRALVADACAALEAIHAAGLAHGDVSPNNLIATPGGWKLIDFGATRASGTAIAAGTPRFVAPECLSDARGSASADLYGLAACAYLALTGAEPLAEIPPRGLAHATATRMPLDPRLREVDNAIAYVLQIGLAKSPGERFEDVPAFRAAMLDAIDGSAPADALRARAARVAPWSVAPPAVEWETTDAAARRASPESTDPVDRRSSSLRDAARSGEAGAFDRREPEPLPELLPSLDATRSAAWHSALGDRVRRQRAVLLLVCLGGAVLLGAIAREREALVAAWIGIGGIALTLAIQRTASNGPRVALATLSVGPAFAFGLHSGFAAVIALVLFAGGMFRTPSRSPWWSREWVVPATIVVVHSAVYILIATGMIPDAGNTPTRYPGAPIGTGPLLHLAVMTFYVAAFVAARIIDARQAELSRRNEIATRDAAHKEMLLATARAELDRALAGESAGLFTGSRIGGFEVERLRGRGGMGEVYEARRDHQRVALKVIRPDRIANPDSLRRFSREASLLRRVDSPYVARVLEVGTDDRLPFLAMELVDGTSLAELLRTGRRIDAAFLRAMIHDVARGLEDVHRAGVLHRDVKPSNLVLTEDGEHAARSRWKLVDFGIAKLVEAPAETTGSLVMGTPAYMSPEQLEGKAIDGRSDLFGLCVVIYRAATGRPAWTTESALAATRSQPGDPCRNGELPGDVGLALRIGLATAAADRFHTASELAAAFDTAFDGRLDEALRRRARTLLAREPWARE